MAELVAPFRRATVDDAAELAELVNIAGEGMPLYLWTRMAEPGESPRDVGHRRALRESGSFSYRNAVVRDEDGRVAACLVGYRLPDTPDAWDYDSLPPMFVPLQQLEDLAAGTWYVNVVATYPEHRGKGYGTALMSVAEQLAAESASNGLSLVVADANRGARRLYERLGYAERARRPIVKEDWSNPGSEWVLLVRG